LKRIQPSILPDLRPLLNLTGDRLRALPMLIVYLTDGCNSRCVTCDIWKLPRRNMSLALAEKLASEFRALGVHRVILSGGEAMQHPDWPHIAQLFRTQGAKVELLTNGLMLNKQAEDVIESIDHLIVSLDGGIPETYKAIRGVDGFNLILSGMIKCADAGVPITTRTTIQCGNYFEMPQIIDVARNAGVRKISFLAVDVSSTQAFGPRFATDIASAQPSLLLHAPPSPALSAQDLPEFSAVLDRLEHDYAADFASGLIAESPTKLRRLYDYFATLNGKSPFPPPRCNAPHLSAVVEVDGSLRPCFFLPRVSKLGDGTLLETLNTPPAVEMRKAYRTGQRSECSRCVCSLYQGPRTLLRSVLNPPDSDTHSIVLDKIASEKNNRSVDIATAYDTVAIHYDMQLAPAQWVRER
jgi:MoaA/NifB/PqqE/SkfB family radical SAM enzyme